MSSRGKKRAQRWKYRCWKLEHSRPQDEDGWGKKRRDEFRTCLLISILEQCLWMTTYKQWNITQDFVIKLYVNLTCITQITQIVVPKNLWVVLKKIWVDLRRIDLERVDLVRVDFKRVELERLNRQLWLCQLNKKARCPLSMVLPVTSIVDLRFFCHSVATKIPPNNKWHQNVISLWGLRWFFFL